ncbi:MAG: glycoside hydrolase family 31 protein [Eubacteriales bacterium]|nr:glycoside hydrolase family 31 protein [Eubacteriales bacterium]
MDLLPTGKFKDVFSAQGNRLVRHFDAETMWIEAWGANSLRVRATKQAEMGEMDWALTETPAACAAVIDIQERFATITNGRITARVSAGGQITFTNQKGEVLLDEYMRNRLDVMAPNCSALEIEAREFKPILGGDYTLSVRFESDPGEKLYGMGQYQQPLLNLKGCELELAHRNSQASVPFCLSSLGYGFLWNNPGVGRVTFGRNLTTWQAVSTKMLDYWITAGDTPAQIEEAYAAVTGTVPMMPDYAMGFWQCKLRYQTREQLMNVAHEYKRRGLPISVIVVDFFHWPNQGDWKFDEEYWPDPDGMIAELKEMGIELMVSIWPTVDQNSENYQTMLNKGYLIRTDRGLRVAMDFMANTIHYDATNPAARQFVWDTAKKNYYDRGIKVFWLDEAEPEYSVYDFDLYRYHMGPNVQIGNVYPVMYAKTFFDGMKAERQENIINLLRCAWAGSQKYGALVWSGDIHSSFASLRNQFAAGLNMGIAGIPWWTTDIGGFHGGVPADPAFQELLVRWFQYGAFCPVMRLHGDREPHVPGVGPSGGGKLMSGGPNEVWSYGDKALEVCSKFMFLRERMKPYITRLMQDAHEKGSPVMRPLFYEFASDARSWEIEDEYLFGPDVLVAPVMEAGMTHRQVYLPAGARWMDVNTLVQYDGGQTVEVETPIENLPVFQRVGSDLGFSWN